MICWKCWKRAPKGLRDNYSKFKRRLNAASKRMTGDIPLLERIVDRAFRRVHRALIEQPQGDELPGLMLEELRKIAII